MNLRDQMQELGVEVRHARLREGPACDAGCRHRRFSEKKRRRKKKKKKKKSL